MENYLISHKPQSLISIKDNITTGIKEELKNSFADDFNIITTKLQAVSNEIWLFLMWHESIKHAF